MSAYKLVIFDFEGTLYDTLNAIIACVEEAYQALQQPIPPRSQIDQVIRMSLGTETAIRLLSPNASAALRSQLLQRYAALYLTKGEAKSAPFDGVETVLTQLQAAGIKIAIVSNKMIEAIETALEHFRLKPYIDVSVGIGSGVERKPDPMAYNTIIKPKFPQLHNEQVLMVGDSVTDLEFARNIGCDACWAAYGYGHPAACLSLKPSYTLQRLTELSKIVLSPQ